MFLASTQSSTIKVVRVIYFEPYQYKRTVKTYSVHDIFNINIPVYL
jgi:hypothetical protein